MDILGPNPGTHAGRLPFPLHQSRLSGTAGPGRFPELHLYHGSRCNRACAFCTVNGQPGGWHAAFPREALDAALRWIDPAGNLKVYGGEPTLDLPSLLDAFRYLRAGGFTGWLTVFSNGVLPDRVIALLEADPLTEVVLNHSILHGIDAEPLPVEAGAMLERWANAQPGRLFASHPDLVPVGRGAAFLTAHSAERGLFGGSCPRCYPVLTSRGTLHACPFAVEIDLPHHRLEGPGGSGALAVASHARFLAWIDTELEPRAHAAGLHPCVACAGGR